VAGGVIGTSAFLLSEALAVLSCEATSPFNIKTIMTENIYHQNLIQFMLFNLLCFFVLNNFHRQWVNI